MNSRAEGVVLDGRDDATVLARAVARVRQVLPESALGSAVEFLSPTRARGKTRRNLGARGSCSCVLSRLRR